MTRPANPLRPPNTQPWSKPVSPDMTAWSVSILRDPFDYPMFSETRNVFGGSVVLARVEWHDWTYRNGVKVSGTFRGVTLYEVLPGARLGGELAATSTVEGIDVSHYQGNIDWRKVVDSGKAFAFMKATEGEGAIDGAFAANWSASRSAGILRGAYHFYHPKQDALRQAKAFLARLDVKGELPPVIDVEQSDDVEVGEIAAGVSAWVDYVTATYARPMVYVSPAFWSRLPPVAVETQADLWIAKWGSTPPTALGAWTNWSFWQYSDKGNVGGIGGKVDLDRFNGSIDDLHTFATRSGDGSDPTLPTFELTTTRGVQQALNYLGASPPLDVDGIRGPQTIVAIQTFQRAHDLAADGVVGQHTIAALRAALPQPG